MLSTPSDTAGIGKPAVPGKQESLTKILADSRILIVDDQVDNLRVLTTVLEFAGYQNVRSLNDSRNLLSTVGEYRPDLVLLDLHMPHVDGLEAMDQLATVTPEDDYLPILVLTGDGRSEARENALSHGAHDFLSKPLNRTEVRLRVKNLLQTRHLHVQLKAHNASLEQQVQERTRELAETQGRLKLLDRAKNDFLKLIHHEFRTPLTGLLGAGALALDELGSTESGTVLRSVFDQSRRRMLTILDDALLLTEIEVANAGFSSEATDLASTLAAAIEGAAGFAQSRGVAVELEPGASGCVFAKQELLLKAIQALLETAVKFSKAGEVVRLKCHPCPPVVEVLIRGGGRIPESAIAGFFEVFSIGEAITPGGDLGLGPPVSQRILALFNGSVTVSNLESSGIQFTVSLKN